ncbi:patatin-like phospholipase domain-containing protein 5 [Urocitellus parryii]|uniref:patatin-like phospholipase domain-containing protein 5 n=1 Tax=Urocitellus parryii TaxID=9999 RepID=UPI000E560AE8|nr:patatin-like phospholipase domain-containing protein 5 [Urocitellus parryii]
MDFLEEGSWSLSFAGAGFLGLYHVGVTHCLSERAPRLLQGARRFYGSSSGALNALAIVCSKSTDFCCSHLLDLVKHVEGLSLGIFHPAYAPIEHIKQQLQDELPENSHILASQRLGISLTRWPDGHNFIVTDFATRDELIQALVCTLYFPFYCGTIPPEFRGQRYFDGALSNNLPFADCPSTITVSPFHGTVDICPRSTSASLHELNAFNASFQISTKNFFLGFISLIPPKPEVVADSCRQGYLDALRFLEARGLTKEPVLWTLVSRDTPAPPARTPDDGTSFNCHVPTVLVKDVPSLEQLSPELEAALRKAVRRDLSAWARFRRSGPGQVLTYLLLPCTLPFEYVYFRSRRVVIWLPDAPADLWWMWGLVKSTALEIHSRTKARLLRLVSLPVTVVEDTAPSSPGKLLPWPCPQSCGPPSGL